MAALFGRTRRYNTNHFLPCPYPSAFALTHQACVRCTRVVPQQQRAHLTLERLLASSYFFLFFLSTRHVRTTCDSIFRFTLDSFQILQHILITLTITRPFFIFLFTEGRRKESNNIDLETIDLESGDL